MLIAENVKLSRIYQKIINTKITNYNYNII